MASTTDPELKSSEPPPPPPPAATADAVDYFKIDVILRVLLFASSLAAIIVIVTSQQTEIVPLLTGGFARRPAKFKYFVAAFSVSGLYSIITTLASISVIQKPQLKLKFLIQFIFWDTLILGIIASATGAAGGVAYVGLKGNDHVSWNKICNVYDKFCRHIAASLAVALFGSVVTLLLIWFSAKALHHRVPK
ncbi:CASP-like protein 1D1 [Senna tora]|uniref:CASP-like protein n=1 Tax=Senna tora TaxID=362788 RepID=A0A834T290_9FABA|nr:CASP-like protein 1D1 [Senna tora]